MDVYEWIELGVQQGFCSPAVCATHDGVPNVDDEAAEWEEGGDPCQHIIRVLHPGEHLSE